jgi:ATP phosphoribosyltransferase-like protein
MRAHGLKAIDTLLDSTAILIRSKQLKDPSHKSLVDIIAARISGVISQFSPPLSSTFPFLREGQRLAPCSLTNLCPLNLQAAQKYVLCQYNIARPLLDAATRITPGKQAPTITALYDTDWMAVSAMVESDKIATVMDNLLECGATDILVIKLENSRAR